MCVTIVKFFISVKMAGYIAPRRGLRQGDLLSPYLFILCAKGLSTLIKDAKMKSGLHGVKIYKGAILLFRTCYLHMKFLTTRKTRFNIDGLTSIFDKTDVNVNTVA